MRALYSSVTYQVVRTSAPLSADGETTGEEPTSPEAVENYTVKIMRIKKLMQRTANA